MKLSSIKKGICCLLLAGIALNSYGCSVTDITDKLQSQDKLYEKLHSSPRFWNDTVQLEGYSGLYKLNSEFFAGKPYNDIYSFGDNILLVGQGIYDDKKNGFFDSLFHKGSDRKEEKEEWDDGWDDGDLEGGSEPSAENYKYSFEVYNPWKNSISAELEYDEIKCDYYKVIGDKLYLFQDSSSTATVYDSDLEKIGELNAQWFIDNNTMKFNYGANTTDYCYDYSNQSDSILKINSENFDFSEYNCGFYQPKINSISADGSQILISGIDSLDLKYKTSAFDSSTMKPTGSYIQANTHNGAINNNSFITEVDYTYSIWNYHRTDKIEDNDIYFSCPDIQNVQYLPNETFVIHQEKNIDKKKDKKHSFSYYQMSPKGKCLSSFTFDCGKPSNQDFSYVSQNYAYLKDCNCIMFLVYTSDCNPYLLVWNLSGGNDTKFKPKIYKDLTTATTVLEEKANKKKFNKNSNKANYGTTVTLIDSPEKYDWGNLSQINDKACELEKKYNVNIYLGPEVPKRIDYFDIVQESRLMVLQKAMNRLEKILEAYPSNFFQQLCYGNLKGIRIYLAGDIKGGTEGMISDPSGFTSEINNYRVIALDTGYIWDWDYTVNHEISHMIDRRLDFLAEYKKDTLFSENKWNSYNPIGFKYLDSYDNYSSNESYVKNHPSYFFDAYGTTFATEDRAEIFGNAMDYYINEMDGQAFFKNDSVLKKKLIYYCECIRDGFNTQGWQRTMPWEIFTY